MFLLGTLLGMLIMFLSAVIWKLKCDLKQAKNENDDWCRAYTSLKEDYLKYYGLYIQLCDDVERYENKLEERKCFGSVH